MYSFTSFKLFLQRELEKLNFFFPKTVLTLILTTLLYGTAYTQGIISGTAVDKENGEPLIGANIFLEGTTTGAATDIDGNYRISGIAVGSYTLIASMIGYSKLIVTDVEVKDNEILKLDLILSEEAIQTDEVVITARLILNNEASLLKERQKSSSISDAISSELILRSGSSNAADAMTKVTGASVVGGKYVYIRGLGERYSGTHLNGTELPSADPDKKSFNMDLFPSGVLDNIITIKSFTPDKPGNFSGGIVDIGTKSYPDQFTLKLSGSSSYNTSSTFNQNYLTYNGGGTDWLGMDDGKRKMPDILSNPNLQIPGITSARTNDQQAKLLDEISDSFAPQMSPNKKTAPVNQSYSLSVGDQTELFGMPLGFLGSYSYSRDYSFYENGKSGRWKLTGNVNTIETLDELQFLTDSKGSDEVNWGSLVTLNIKPDPMHEVGFDFVYTQSGQSSARFLEGRWLEQFNDAPNAILETRVLSYTERNLQSYQVHGRHILNNFLDLGINWSATVSKTSQDEPDARYFTNHYNNQNMNYSINRGNYALPSRYFRNMNEQGNGANLDLSFPFRILSNKEAKFKTGGSFLEKERVFSERRFEYQPGEYSLGAPRYNGDPEFFFSSENVGVLWYDSTRNRYVFGNYIAEVPDPLGGNYNGDEKISAVYAMIELPVDNSIRLIGGARYEITKMNVYGKSRKGFLDEKDLLPAVSLIYNLSENMNIRSSFGKTLARPNFREKAPYANFNFVGDFTFLGNPDLKRTLIDNYDLRWEWFLRPGEIVAVSGFYKYFKNPIERIINVQYSSEGGEIYYENIDEANVMGVEIEVRKRLDEILETLNDFSIGANVSFIKSEVDIPEGELAVIRQNDPDAKSTRRLQGQSPYLINLELGYLNSNTGTSASVFYNVFGDRLAEVSIGGTPDIFERSRPMLDFIASQNLPGNFSIRLSVKNILNSAYKLTHEFKGNEYVRTEYKTGASVSVGLSYSLN